MSSQSLNVAAAALNPVSYVANVMVPRTILGGAKSSVTPLTGEGESAAVKAAKELEAKRKAQLAQEAKDRADAKTRAETSGQRAGLSSRSSLAPTLGFGSGNTAGGARGNLFGN